MAGVDDLDPLLQWAVRSGLMTEAQARDVDAFADGVVQRKRAGELSAEEADRLVVRRAYSDAVAFNRGRK